MPVAAPPRPSVAAGEASRTAGSRAHAGSALRTPGDGRIRWDRLGRIALLVLLAIVLALYIAPLRAWISQSQAAEVQRAELHALEREHERLSHRARELGRAAALEREARSYGMVRRGERAFVIQQPPPRRRR